MEGGGQGLCVLHETESTCSNSQKDPHTQVATLTHTRKRRGRRTHTNSWKKPITAMKPNMHPSQAVDLVVLFVLTSVCYASVLPSLMSLS